MSNPPTGAGPPTAPPPANQAEIAEAMKTLKLVQNNMSQKAEGLKMEALMLDEAKKQTAYLENMYKILYLAAKKFKLVD